MEYQRITRLALALGLAGLLPAHGDVIAQEACRGWAATCASVAVRSEGDELVLFAPNLASSDSSETAESARVDPEAEPCDRDDARMEEAPAPDENDRERCRRAPVGAFFIVALPASLFVFAPDGQGPTVESPALPQEPVTTPGDGGGDGDDGGAGVGGEGVTDGGSGDGGAAGGGTGGAGGGATGGGTTGGGVPGGGVTGGGTTGGGATGGPSWHPGAGDLPPLSQVPEPFSTTLFGIGLAGLAGNRIRRRRKADSLEER